MIVEVLDFWKRVGREQNEECAHSDLHKNLSLFEILVIDHHSEPTKQSGIQNKAEKNNLKHADMLKK